jgi:hypothetical protein
MLTDYLLTKADINAYLTQPLNPLMPGLDPVITNKLRAASALLKSPYIIDKNAYDHIYVTSDIHADLEKLDNMITKLGLVNYTDTSPKTPVMLPVYTEWIPERTLFIIVGDVVDGARNSEGSKIPDPVGNIELMLHAYLYNIRIKARMKKSEVRFVIGNHDFETVIKKTLNVDLCNEYIHRKAYQFFGNGDGGISATYQNRSQCLKPFYNCCPYLFTTVADEIAFIHGGLHDGGKQLLDSVVRQQENIDEANNFSALNQAILDGEKNPLWTRYYATESVDKVNQLINSVNFKTVIVGHCQMGIGPNGTPMGKFEKHTASILASEPYAKYKCGIDGNGCVVSSCYSIADASPHLAFVDIGFSRTFSPEDLEVNNPRRRAEMLCFKHEPENPIFLRHYNIIIRVNTTDRATDEIVWKHPSIEGFLAPKNVLLNKTYTKYLDISGVQDITGLHLAVLTLDIDLVQEILKQIRKTHGPQSNVLADKKATLITLTDNGLTITKSRKKTARGLADLMLQKVSPLSKDAVTLKKIKCLLFKAGAKAKYENPMWSRKVRSENRILQTANCDSIKGGRKTRRRRL